MRLFRGFRSIASQLTYGFIALAVVAAFASGALLMTIADDYSTRDRQRILNLEARLAAERINGYSESLFNRLNYLASIPGLINMHRDSMHSLLEGLSRLNQAYHAAGIADLNGKLLAKVGDWDRVPDMLHRNPVFRLAAKSRFNAIGPLTVLPGTETPAIEIAVPVRDKSGKAAGVLWAQVSLKYLMLVLGDLPIGKTGYGYIVDDKDFLIALDAEGDPRLEPLEAPELQKTIARSLGYGARPDPYVGLYGEKVLGTVSPVTSLGLRLVVEMPQAEVYAPRTAMIKATCIALLILATAAALLAYLYSRRFVRPLRTFTSAARKVAEGDLDVHIAYAEENELGTLARTFNDMTSRLKDGLKSLNEEITERKLAEQALRIAEQQYRSIFERAQEGIIQTSTDGRILIANPAAASIFGYDSFEELLRETDANIRKVYAHPEEREEFLGKLHQGARISGRMMEMVRKDGERIWIMLHAQVSMDQNGEYTLIDSTFQDVTERLRAEKALADLNATLEKTVEERTHDLFIKARELEEANHRLRQLDRMKSSFLSSVSHELRTPLTSILASPSSSARSSSVRLPEPARTTRSSNERPTASSRTCRWWKRKATA
ncbi:cache domain-containing protein [Salidesulfovibrio brasiliensis]|uniref:cache domain-containing protein n=1 Tax=Salidesulfovibrio brasiliensis TaxID=221711 RepID=UPI0006CF68C8|nr:PAS domain S-box protein [Salidesulfovibrio brasiliensis]